MIHYSPCIYFPTFNRKKEPKTHDFQHVLKECQRLQAQLDQLTAKIQQYPSENLICCHSKKHTKWYKSNGHTRSYIPKTNLPLAKHLAEKKYISCLIEDTQNRLMALEPYIKLHKVSDKSTQLLQITGYAELLSAPEYTFSEELQNWMNTPYIPNPNHPEHLTHKTLSGHFVRSKSEFIIDSLLTSNRIPFRYEADLLLGTTTIYPDFTIRHPKTGEYFYWEHFGLMNDPTYQKNVFSKLQLYTKHRIIPSVNLLTTYETQDIPLDARLVLKLIEHYFL